MRIEELNALAAGGESAQVEFKKSTGQRTEAAKAACGMLNGEGGYVLFGIASDGSLVGQEMGVTTTEDVIAELRRIEPQTPITPEAVPIGQKRCILVLSVPGASGAIYTFDGRPYIRHGPTTVVMGQEEYRRRLLEQMHPSHRWEIQAARGVRIDDLDSGEIVRTIEEAIRRGRSNDPGTRDVAELLRGLSLLRDGVPLNAAVVLFARDDRFLPAYPQCLLRMARFRGTTSAEFEDNRQAHGNLFGLLQRAQSFLRDHLPVAGRIVPSLFDREDDPLYPLEALREALANAFCHRDYMVGGGSVSVAIFDDRLEISSTGRLPFGLTVDDLKRPHPSRPWNPVIAQVLFRRGLIEQWGRGTLRIRELVQLAGLATPEFEERAGEVVVRFFPTGYVAPRRIDHPLTPQQQEILEALATLGSALLSEVRASMRSAPSERALQFALQTLRDLRLVEVKGRGRGAKWRLRGRKT